MDEQTQDAVEQTAVEQEPAAEAVVVDEAAETFAAQAAGPDEGEIVVFAFRLTLAERNALKAAAKRDGWDRKAGGVTAWARANLKVLAE